MENNNTDSFDLKIFQMFHNWEQDDNETLVLMHSGIPHDGAIPHSGRYPWGSGEKALQRSWDLKSRAKKYEDLGYSEVEIAKMMGFYKLNSKGEPILNEKGDPMGNTKALRANLQIATETIRADNFARIDNLRSEGKGWTEIAKELGLPNESTARSAWTRGQKKSANKTEKVANDLKEAVKNKGYIDVGSGVNQMLGCSPNALDTALERLKAEGYEVQNIYVPQLSNNLQKTTVRVLAKPGTTYSDIWNNRDKVALVVDNNGKITTTPSLDLQPIPSVSSKRIDILYGDQGGKKQDGLIELRAVRNKDGSLSPACDDLSLGEAKYGQVRIAVDGKYYIKGMARYNPDLPDGIDIRVNSNKDSSKGMENALKKLDTESDNPFGTNVVATGYLKDGKMVRSPLNIVGSKGDAHVEGAWEEWSKTLPAQFLAKQPEALVKRQLQLTKDEKIAELDKIRRLTNPVVKRKMLLDFADECDGAAVDLKAVKLPNQAQKVLLPIPSLKDNEIYAPQFDNGTQVALVRYPHAGPFEIPVLTVNNKNKEANTVMRNARDAVGINAHNASILSGADFDGDTATIIPLSKKTADGFVRTVTMKTHNDIQVPGLKDFDPTDAYGPDNYNWDPKSDKPAPYKIMTKQQRGIEMGVVSNLITDMYAHGCEDVKELERADKYSMVVIDANKHNLNYMQARKDYDIESLQKKYQQHPGTKKGYGGASSLISRSKSEERVVLRDLRKSIDPETGELIFREASNSKYSSSPKIYAKDPETNRYLKDSNGKRIYETVNGKYVKNKDGSYGYLQGDYPGTKSNRYLYDESKATEKTHMQKSTKMAEAKDARTLLSDYDISTGTWSGSSLPIERMYAEYANTCKALANEARKESLTVPHLRYSAAAAAKYKEETKSLISKYNNAVANSPRERQAQIMATSKYHALEEAHPEWDNNTKKKQRGMALNQAREVTGAKKDRVIFEPKEWEAIQAGAIAEGTLEKLLSQADKESYTKMATPRESIDIPASRKAIIKEMYTSGVYTQAEIADHFGISASSVSKVISE